MYSDQFGICQYICKFSSWVSSKLIYICKNVCIYVTDKKKKSFKSVLPMKLPKSD